VVDLYGGSLDEVLPSLLHLTHKRLEWDAQGNLAAWTDCSGRRSALRHDGLGRLVAQTDALGQETRYTWDAAGRLLVLAEPGTPDPLNPLGPSRQACLHRYTWSAEGRLLAYTNPLGADRARAPSVFNSCTPACTRQCWGSAAPSR
jgi:YD repeat-containing protein